MLLQTALLPQLYCEKEDFNSSWFTVAPPSAVGFNGVPQIYCEKRDIDSSFCSITPASASNLSSNDVFTATEQAPPSLSQTNNNHGLFGRPSVPSRLREVTNSNTSDTETPQSAVLMLAGTKRQADPMANSSNKIHRVRPVQDPRKYTTTPSILNAPTEPRAMRSITTAGTKRAAVPLANSSNKIHRPSAPRDSRSLNPLAIAPQPLMNIPTEPRAMRFIAPLNPLKHSTSILTRSNATSLGDQENSYSAKEDIVDDANVILTGSNATPVGTPHEHGAFACLANSKHLSKVLTGSNTTPVGRRKFSSSVESLSSSDDGSALRQTYALPPRPPQPHKRTHGYHDFDRPAEPDYEYELKPTLGRYYDRPTGPTTSGTGLRAGWWL